MDWLFVGSAPSVLRGLHATRDMPCRTITTNAGIKLVPIPTVYVTVDMRAGPRYENMARCAQRHGTRLVSLQRCEKAQRERKVDFYDEFLELGQESTRTSYGPFRYSGPLCIEYACHQGADTIHMVGFDGYKHDLDYFDPEDPVRQMKKLSRPRADTHNEEFAQRAKTLSEVWPDVSFVLWGNPVWQTPDSWDVRRFA